MKRTFGLAIACLTLVVAPAALSIAEATYPEVEIIGLDPDPKALAWARRKVERARVSVQFDQGFAGALEYPAATFEAVFCSFMFHHLQGDEKEKTLREIRRVLKPGERLYLLDFEVRKSDSEHRFFRFVHSDERLADNSENRILTLMTEAGLVDANKVGNRIAIFGLAHVGYYEASVPRSGARRES